MTNKLSNSNLFIGLAKSKEYDHNNDISRIISINEFVDEYIGLITNNGNSWGRKDSSLCKKYKLITINARGKIEYKFYLNGDENENRFTKEILEYFDNNKEKDFPKLNGNKVIYYKICGLNKDDLTNNIREDIITIIKSKKCPVLGISDVEVDHKNGRKNNPLVLKLETQKISDFQPLSRSANIAKREHCKVCKESNIRFDAKILNLSYPSYTYGNKLYPEGDINGCIGCYWYDIEDFGKKISNREQSYTTNLENDFSQIKL